MARRSTNTTAIYRDGICLLFANLFVIDKVLVETKIAPDSKKKSKVSSSETGKEMAMALT